MLNNVILLAKDRHNKSYEKIYFMNKVNHHVRAIQ